MLLITHNSLIRYFFVCSMKMCPRRHWLYSSLTFCIPTSLSQLIIKIAEILTQTERKLCKNMQNILLDGCYLRFEEYLQENTSFYILKSAEKQAKVLKKSLRGGKLTNILHE